MTRSAAHRARIAEARQAEIEAATATRTYIVATRRKVNEKGQGEEVELPRDQAARLLAAGLVEEKTPLQTETTPAEAVSTADIGPSAPRTRKGR